MKLRLVTLCALTLTVLIGICPVLAQDSDHAADSDDAAMMHAFMQAATPGAQHEMLAASIGDWNLVVKMWMDPSAEPMVSKATAHREMIMGGRYMVEEVTGNVMGMPFTGHGMAGYDNVTGKFWSTWVDNMSTGVMTSTGTYDEASKTSTYWGEGADPVSGGMAKNKTVIQHISADKEVMTMYMIQGGQEIKNMEITWTRSGS